MNAQGKEHTPEIQQLNDCPKCGTSNAADARYCEVCGAHLDPGATRSRATTSQPQKRSIIDRLFGRRAD